MYDLLYCDCVMFREVKENKDDKGDYDGIPYVSLSSPQLTTPERKIPTSKEPASIDPTKVKEARRTSHRSDHSQSPSRSDLPQTSPTGSSKNTHIREVSIYNEESIRKLSYPGEAIFPDN